MGTDPYQIEPLIEPIVNAMGYDLWGCDFRESAKQAFLRVYIDKQEGVTLDDCARVSHQLSGVLDVEDPIEKPYTLEVSSPGLDRPLLREAHFRRYVGRRVKVRLRWLLEGRRNIVGDLRDVMTGSILVRQDDADYKIPLDAVQRARLEPDL